MHTGTSLVHHSLNALSKLS